MKWKKDHLVDPFAYYFKNHKRVFYSNNALDFLKRFKAEHYFWNGLFMLFSIVMMVDSRKSC